MSLRAYVWYLQETGVSRGSVVDEFLNLYEQARFGSAAVTEREFKTLMELFAEVLSGTGERNANVGAGASSAIGEDEGSEVGSVRRLGQTQERAGTARSVASRASMASLESTESVVRHVLT